jgi:hypothetical protein
MKLQDQLASSSGFRPIPPSTEHGRVRIMITLKPISLRIHHHFFAALAALSMHRAAVEELLSIALAVVPAKDATGIRSASYPVHQA